MQSDQSPENTWEPRTAEILQGLMDDMEEDLRSRYRASAIDMSREAHHIIAVLGPTGVMVECKLLSKIDHAQTILASGIKQWYNDADDTGPADTRPEW